MVEVVNFLSTVFGMAMTVNERSKIWSLDMQLYKPLSLFRSDSIVKLKKGYFMLIKDH